MDPAISGNDATVPGDGFGKRTYEWELYEPEDVGRRYRVRIDGKHSIRGRDACNGPGRQPGLQDQGVAG